MTDPPAPQPPPEPPAPPAPEPPPAPPVEPGDIGALVDRLAAFDPADLAARLQALEDRAGDAGGTDFATAVRETLGPMFDGLLASWQETRDAISGYLSALAGGPPPAPPSSDPPPDPPPAPPVPSPPRGGFFDALFDVPKVPGQ